MAMRRIAKILLIVLFIIVITVLLVTHFYKSESFSTEGMSPLEIQYYSEMTASERERAIKVAVINSEVEEETWVNVIKDGVDSEAVYILEGDGRDALPGEELIVVPSKPFDPNEPVITAEKCFWTIVV